MGIFIEQEPFSFSRKFWRDIGMITPCDIYLTKFSENTNTYDKFIERGKKLLEYVLLSHKEQSLLDDKFDVVIGSVNYVLKIFVEIVNNSLGNSILGRHGIRTIIEVYIRACFKFNLENC